jgi:2-polyprenyl-3-methyl-5-hydroxy-6-metoxy-1,4-benzoquinol methylase
MSEYIWNSPNLPCHSSYVLPAIRDWSKDLAPGSIVVDVGCGNCSLLGQFLDRGWDLRAIDMSLSGITIAKRAFPEISFSVGDVTGDISHLNLNGCCDLVISTEVVEHLFLPRAFAKNCYALLKPNGCLIITTPYHGYLKDLGLAVLGRMDEQYTALWDYGHIKFWSKKTLTQLLDEAGFEIIHFEGLGRCIPWLWKNMLMVVRKPRLTGTAT